MSHWFIGPLIHWCYISFVPPAALTSWFPTIDPVATARGSDMLAFDRLEGQRIVLLIGGVTNGS
jgi:hypothetical protein